MMISSAVSVVVTNGKAYLPILARAPMGFFEVDPIRIEELTLTELTQAIEGVKNQGNPEITLEEVNWIISDKLPILRATKKHSEKQLGLTGKAYSITWGENDITLSSSTQDKRNRWIFEKPNIHQYPLNTPLKVLAEFIVEDARSCSEVW